LLQKPEYRVKRLENERVHVTRIAEPLMRENENICEVHYDVFIRNKETKEIREIKEQHNMRFFFLDEVKMLVLQSGFDFVDMFEFMTWRKISKDSWGACFVIRKRNEI